MMIGRTIASVILISLLSSVNLHAFQATFTPRLRVGEEYTDNVFLTRDDTEQDFITTITPGATLSLIGRRSTVDLSYDPTYSHYHEFPENDGFRHSARLNARSDVSKNTQLYLNDSFLYTEDPAPQEDAYIDLPLPGRDVTIRRGREPYWRNTATAGVTRQFGPRDSWDLNYTYAVLENEDDAIEDSREHTPALDLTWWVTPRWGTEAHLSYTRGTFDQSDDLERYNGRLRLKRSFSRRFSGFVSYGHTDLNYPDNPDADYQVYNPSIGIEYILEENADISIGGGYIWVDRADGAAQDDEENFIVNSSIRKIWPFQYGAVTLTGASGYDQSLFDAENLGLRVYYQGRLSGQYRFSRHAGGDLFAAFRRDDYLDSDPDRQDETTSFGGGISYGGAGIVSARLGCTYRTVTSTEEENEYTENRVSFTLTLAPRRPLYIKR